MSWDHGLLETLTLYAVQAQILLLGIVQASDRSRRRYRYRK